MPAFRTPRLPAAMMLSFALPLAFLFFNIFCPPDTPPKPPEDYKARTSPENVLWDLAHLYQKLDANEYDSTLASNYVFRFQKTDIQPGAADSLTRAEEMNFAQNLFHNGGPEGALPASRIALTMTTLSSDDDNRLGHAGWKRYVVNTALIIDFANSDQISVNSPAWFYFRQEPANSGVWVLAEWADQPGSTGAAGTATSGRVRQLALGQIVGVPPGPAANP